MFSKLNLAVLDLTRTKQIGLLNAQYYVGQNTVIKIIASEKYTTNQQTENIHACLGYCSFHL